METFLGSMLYSTVQEEQWNEARDLIEDGADVNHRNHQNYTPLHWAQNPEIAALLIKKGADVNAVDDEGYTPLHLAVLLCNYEFAATLLYFNADPSVPNEKGYTPIMDSIAQGSQVFEITEMLLDYDYNLNQLTNNGSSVLPMAIAQKSPYIDEIIYRGGAFNNLSHDVGMLIHCIHGDIDDFKWFWNVFKYEETWNYNISILGCLLSLKQYDKFDYVIGSHKIGEVVKVFYRNEKRKRFFLQFSEEFSLSMVLQAVRLGYNKRKAKEAILVLLSYGYLPFKHEAVDIFGMFGYCHLFELFLYMDLSIRIYRFYPLIPKVLLHPDRSIKILTDEFLLHKSDITKESLMLAASFIYDSRLINLLEECCDPADDMLDSLRQRSMPSLTELSRNVTRQVIWKKYNVKNTPQFYTIVRWLNSPPVTKDIITFKIPLYVASNHTDYFKTLNFFRVKPKKSK